MLVIGLYAGLVLIILKVAEVARGYLVGDPNPEIPDPLAGSPLERMTRAADAILAGPSNSGPIHPS